ncbi:zeta toxin family protein [Echinicola sp. 20G]|uniref:zeta toxin family protein n=1 Tax=Echinicola sp. 20G TaxID=2781961 RepID=UPI001910F643|nr:zeta toxin family protein [Echinicola sp. 20G]
MTKRMRIFAGPNGSGKSSIIKAIRNTEVQSGKTLDFGIYINADDIAQDLYNSGLDFSTYKIIYDQQEFEEVAHNSGLIRREFPLPRLMQCIKVSNNRLKVIRKIADEKNDNPYERIAQILADFLRKKLLKEGVKFSFETVFSHPSKVAIIKQAKEAGYKVYLYFVSTEDPTINVHRVKKVRVPQDGHDVPEDKIIDRYYRSMDLLYKAAQHCYQAYFFDNSKEGERHNLFAHFKLNGRGKKVWNDIKNEEVPEWFKHYYSGKIG